MKLSELIRRTQPVGWLVPALDFVPPTEAFLLRIAPVEAVRAEATRRGLIVRDLHAFTDLNAEPHEVWIKACDPVIFMRLFWHELEHIQRGHTHA